MIQLQGHYELSDFKKAQSLHARGGKLSTWSGYAVIGLIAVMTLLGVVLALWGRFPWEFVTLPMLLVTVWAFFQFGLIPYQLGRVFKQHQDLSAPFEIELTDEEFHFRNEFGNSRMPWENFVKWKEDNDLLLLYRSDRAFHLLPKRLFSSGQEMEYLLSHLRTHNVPNAAKVRNPRQIAVMAGLIIIAIVVFFLNFNSR